MGKLKLDSCEVAFLDANSQVWNLTSSILLLLAIFPLITESIFLL